MTLDDLDALTALRRMSGLAPGEQGTVSISTGATSIRHFMSEAIVEFRFRHPRARLELHTASTSADCLSALLKDDADLAWVTMADPLPGIEQRPVLEMPWVLAMRDGDAYADRAWVEVRELSGLRLIRPPEGSASGGKLAAALADVSLAPDAGSADWDTALLLAELGVGHAILPALPGWRELGDSGPRLVQLRGLPPLSVGWAARSWDALSTPARSFADAVSRNWRTWAA